VGRKFCKCTFYENVAGFVIDEKFVTYLSAYCRLQVCVESHKIEFVRDDQVRYTHEFIRIIGECVLNGTIVEFVRNDEVRDTNTVVS